MKSSQHNSSNHDPSQEEDQLWELLGKSAPIQAPTNFVQNTVRAARLSQEPARPSILSWLTKPIVTLCAATALIVITAMVTLPSDTETSAPRIGSTANTDADWLNEAMLTTATEDPNLFSESELVALIF